MYVCKHDSAGPMVGTFAVGPVASVRLSANVACGFWHVALRYRNFDHFLYFHT